MVKKAVQKKAPKKLSRARKDRLAKKRQKSHRRRPRKGGRLKVALARTKTVVKKVAKKRRKVRKPLTAAMVAAELFEAANPEEPPKKRVRLPRRQKKEEKKACNPVPKRREKRFLGGRGNSLGGRVGPPEGFDRQIDPPAEARFTVPGGRSEDLLRDGGDGRHGYDTRNDDELARDEGYRDADDMVDKVNQFQEELDAAERSRIQEPEFPEEDD